VRVRICLPGMPRFDAVTVVSRTYLPQVRVLADSLAEHNPKVRLTVVVVDEPEGAPRAPESFRILTPVDLGIDRRELHRRALIYDAQGLISSLRPPAIAKLLDQGSDAVVHLDADMLVLAPLDGLWRMAARAGVLLSPHSLTPHGGGAGAWGDERYLRDGAFNGGLIGVGRRGRPFVSWMAERVTRDCVRDPARGIFYSQTWLNLVPALFEHRVDTDPGVNVTAHRLAGADLERSHRRRPGSRTRLAVSGASLRLFHFTGFDPERAELLCRHLDGPAGSLAGRPLLGELCHEYAARLRGRGWPSQDPYGWSHLPGGCAVDDTIRELYAGALRSAETGLCDEPPDPFDTSEPERFVDWLRQPPAELSRYMLGVRERREDLRQAYPRVPGAHQEGFLGWAHWQTRPDLAAPEVPPELATTRATVPREGDGP
jgi:hypothetical protein